MFEVVPLIEGGWGIRHSNNKGNIIGHELNWSEKTVVVVCAAMNASYRLGQKDLQEQLNILLGK